MDPNFQDKDRGRLWKAEADEVKKKYKDQYDKLTLDYKIMLKKWKERKLAVAQHKAKEEGEEKKHSSSWGAVQKFKLKIYPS